MQAKYETGGTRMGRVLKGLMENGTVWVGQMYTLR
jgi:hypothetical protein